MVIMESPIENQKSTQEKILRWGTLFLTLHNQSSMMYTSMLQARYVIYLIDFELIWLKLLLMFLRALQIASLHARLSVPILSFIGHSPWGSILMCIFVKYRHSKCSPRDDWNFSHWKSAYVDVLMSKAVCYSWRSIYMLNNKRSRFHIQNMGLSYMDTLVWNVSQILCIFKVFVTMHRRMHCTKSEQPESRTVLVSIWSTYCIS